MNNNHGLAANGGLHVDIPLLPAIALGNALLCIDLLRTAQMLARLRLGRQAPSISWRLLDAQGRAMPPCPSPWLSYLGAAPPAGPQQGVHHAVFLAPMHAADIPSVRQLIQPLGQLAEALGQAVRVGGSIAIVGNSAWLAARTGQANGYRLALPWFFAGGFSNEFSAIASAGGCQQIEDGPWISVATSSQIGWIVSRLIHRGLGPDLAQLCLGAFEPDSPRANVALKAAQQIPVTRDSSMARALHWLEQHMGQTYDLKTLANAAAVSPRTLLRHFDQALGCSPLEHLHRLRCERARVLLEITLESVPSIAQACGYDDPSAFRRIFRRHCGCTPSEHREQHALRAPRVRWGVSPDSLPGVNHQNKPPS
jgi:transcriptional regulator GlxA family with amidase domain